MEPGVLVFFMVALAVIVFFLIQQARDQQAFTDALKALAGRHEGLRYQDGTYGAQPSVMGEIDGVTVIVDSYSTGTGKKKKTYTRWRLLDVTALPRGTSLHTEGTLSFIGKALTGDDLQIGDPRFDDRVLVRGPPSLRAHLDDAARSRVLQALDRGWSVEDAEWHFQQSGRIDVVQQLEAVLQQGVDLCRGLRRDDDQVERLARIVRSDPVTGVRLRTLQTWLASGKPPTELMEQLARHDDTVVGLLAARHLGDVTGLDRRLGHPTAAVRIQSALTLAEIAAREEPPPRPAELRAVLVQGLDVDPWIDRCIDHLGRLGTVAEVEALKEHAGGVWPGARKQRAREAIGAIQSRVVGAEAGQLSMTEGAGGEVSVAADPKAAGRLSPKQAES